MLYLTDWTLESANTDESPTFSDDDPEGETVINERRATIDNVGSFLSFLDNDSATDAARPAETSEDMSSSGFVFRCIGGNLRKLAEFMQQRRTQGVSKEELCRQLLEDLEIDMRYQLFDEHDFFEIEANHVDASSPRVDASARHFSALDILLGDQIGVTSVADSMQPAIKSRGLRSFAEVFKAFDGGEDAALDIAFHQYMTLVPPRTWDLLTVFEGADDDVDEERNGGDVSVFEWIDLLDPDIDKWRVRADFLTLKAF